MAGWPWPKAEKTSLRRGVDHWLATASDGTTVELIEFDFALNARLRLEMYDRDEDDSEPFNNLADYATRGVGTVVKHLNDKGRGPVVAAWNGLFFAYDFKNGGGPRGLARHVGPVVLRGKAFHNVGNPRWTFGVKERTGRPHFAVLHQPAKAELSKEFDFASAGAQCLRLNGKSLRLQPFPRAGEAPIRQPVPSSPSEAGHIPLIDHMRTSRTSLGWSNDSSKLYLLVVNEPDHELASKLALKRGQAAEGGWTLDDLQRFWTAFGAPNAVNLDGGAVTQLTYLRPDARYELLPPRLVAPNQRMVFEPDFENAPGGGTLMTFYVREVTSTKSGR